MNTAKKLTAAVLAFSALVLAAPTAAQARPVPESEMDRSYTGPTGTRQAAPSLCSSRYLLSYGCVIPRLVTAVLRLR